MTIFSKEYSPTFWWFKKIKEQHPDDKGDLTFKQKLIKLWNDFKDNLKLIITKIKTCITQFSSLSYAQEFLCVVIAIVLVAIVIVGGIMLYFMSGIFTWIVEMIQTLISWVTSLSVLYANFFSFIESGLQSIVGTVRQGLLTFFDIADWIAASTNTSPQLVELVAATISVIAGIDVVRQFVEASGEFDQTAIGRVFKVLDWPFKTFLTWLKEDLPTALWLIAWVIMLPLRGVAMVLSVVAGLIWDLGEVIYNSIRNFGHDENFK